MRVKYLYVYILKCSDNSYYTGVTNNPEKRLEQHNQGIDPNSYTYSRRPVEIVYCERFTDYLLAIMWEKRIKDWSRKKKEALIRGDLDSLKKYAECRNESSHTLLDSARSDSALSTDSARSDSALSTDSARSDNELSTDSASNDKVSSIESVDNKRRPSRTKKSKFK